MPSKLNAYLLSAVVLAALQCAPGAPVEEAPTDSPAGDPSGDEEEEKPSDLLRDSPLWDLMITATKRNKEEFEEEFHHVLKYDHLGKYFSPPAICHKSNFSKEACLHRLVHGLLIYTVLLKHVEKEYPSSRILSEVRLSIGPLIELIKQKMKHPQRVTVLTSSQEDQPLKDLGNLDSFHRKMAAHSILRQLGFFLIEGKRAINKRETPRGSVASVGSFQMFKR